MEAIVPGEGLWYNGCTHAVEMNLLVARSVCLVVAKDSLELNLRNPCGQAFPRRVSMEVMVQ
jgi:hypothetical protein